VGRSGNPSSADRERHRDAEEGRESETQAAPPSAKTEATKATVDTTRLRR